MDAPAALSTLGERAFPTLARPERYFPSASIESARKRVHDCVLRGDGPAVVIGAPGVGKTMLLEVTAALVKDHLRVVRLSGAQLCTRRALMQSLLFGLDLPHRERSEGDLRLTLQQGLAACVAAGRGVAVLVDEAQALPSKLIEELRVLSNFAISGAPVVRLVLFGGPALEDQLATREMECFSQCIAARCYISPMGYEETREYVRAHAAAVGVTAEQVFTSDALDAFFTATDGVPRLVSQLADRALATALNEAKEMIDAQVVQIAWSDLHQLPAPWNTPRVDNAPAVSPATSMIEFGELDEVFEVGPALAEGYEQPAEREPEFNADHALADFAESPAETPREATPDHIEDPFGNEFDEEEVVIDKFAGIDVAFSAATPRVLNEEDPSLSLLADTLAPQAKDEAAIEELLLSNEEDSIVDTELDEPEDDILEEELSTIQISSGDDEEAESEVLIIEHDLEEVETIKRPMVHRREYRQLFTQLHRG